MPSHQSADKIIAAAAVDSAGSITGDDRAASIQSHKPAGVVYTIAAGDIDDGVTGFNRGADAGIHSRKPTNKTHVNTGATATTVIDSAGGITGRD